MNDKNTCPSGSGRLFPVWSWWSHTVWRWILANRQLFVDRPAFDKGRLKILLNPDNHRQFLQVLCCVHFGLCIEQSGRRMKMEQGQPEGGANFIHLILSKDALFFESRLRRKPQSLPRSRHRLKPAPLTQVDSQLHGTAAAHLRAPPALPACGSATKQRAPQTIQPICHIQPSYSSIFMF